MTTSWPRADPVAALGPILSTPHLFHEVAASAYKEAPEAAAAASRRFERLFEMRTMSGYRRQGLVVLIAFLVTVTLVDVGRGQVPTAGYQRCRMFCGISEPVRRYVAYCHNKGIYSHPRAQSNILAAA